MKIREQKRQSVFAEIVIAAQQTMLQSNSLTRYHLVRFIIALFPMKEHLSVYEFNVYIPNCKYDINTKLAF